MYVGGSMDNLFDLIRKQSVHNRNWSLSNLTESYILCLMNYYLNISLDNICSFTQTFSYEMIMADENWVSWWDLGAYVGYKMVFPSQWKGL